jgi:hypothetical protein
LDTNSDGVRSLNDFFVPPSTPKAGDPDDEEVIAICFSLSAV